MFEKHLAQGRYTVGTLNGGPFLLEYKKAWDLCTF